ncbi:MAG: 8-amino-7-oxononanoate synthase 2 [Acidimicrobiales bacterium]|nr:MAG: 8-amino-7-oxononanoate synthase [Actinomycetota bacterium]MBV6508158.1 8-amino-7-oxononanoate synthase 2 [Acidimicrobiales bacterium]
MSWQDWVERSCTEIDLAGQWRRPFDVESGHPLTRVSDSGEEIVSFASNDYLGLTQHPEVIASAIAATTELGVGAGAARLIVGSRPVHTALENDLAAWKDCEAAVLFPTGYAANLGVLTTFGRSEATICSDELNHASIIDGCRLAPAAVAVYRHRDLAHLERLLDNSGPALVVSDTVFSMDGDLAPVDELAELCTRRDALLVLDEAHAVLSPEPALGTAEVLRVGTLSKTLGTLGGFVAGPRRFVDLIVNRARSYIFTTATPPATAAAAAAALSILRSAQGRELRDRLRRLVDLLAPGHPSPILPIIVGSEESAVKASASLLERGLLVPAIRPPTVAPGTCRLRVALSAAHTERQVRALGEALEALDLRRGIAA